MFQSWGRQATNPQTTIVAEDIGVIGFYTSAYIYDAGGLITPAAKDYKNCIGLANKFRPDYLFLTATKESIGLFDDSLSNLYKPIMRFSQSGGNDLRLDSNVYPPSWAQDYMLFRRISQ